MTVSLDPATRQAPAQEAWPLFGIRIRRRGSSSVRWTTS